MVTAILNCSEDLPCWSVLKCFGHYKVDHKNHVSRYHNVRQHLEHEWGEVHSLLIFICNKHDDRD